MRLARLVYPDGRALDYAAFAEPADERLAGIVFDGQTNALYHSLGMDRAVGLDAPAVRAGLPGPGLALRYGDAPGYAGLDRFDRVTDMTWTFGNGETLERFRYAYDRGGRRTRREQPLAPAFSESYEYDAFGQLTCMTRDGGGGWQNWTLEHVGNWSALAGPSGTQTRQHNAANELTALDGNSGVVAHDAAGNMTRLPSDLTGQSLRLTWDAWNRLTRVEAATAGGATTELPAVYAYDGQGRRIRAASGGVTREFYYDEWNLIAEVVTTPIVGSQRGQVALNRYWA